MAKLPRPRWKVESERRAKQRIKYIARKNRELPAGEVKLTSGRFAGLTLPEVAALEGGFEHLERLSRCGDYLTQRAVKTFVVQERHRRRDRALVVDPTLVPPWEGESAWA